MNVVQLACRNVIRNGHRTVVTTSAMAFACAMMIVFATLMEGVVDGSERNIITMNTGDIQIHQFEYRDDPDIYNLISDSSYLAKQLRQQGFAVTERIFASGLMASDDSSSGVQLRGIDLAYESTVTEISQHVMMGQWLSNSDPNGVVLGKKLARLLDVTIGDELIFVGQTADGYMANDAFQVRGILKSVSTNVDSTGIIMLNTSLQQLINLDQGAHQIVVIRPESSTDLAVATEYVQLLVGEQLEVLNWKELLPIISQFIETARVQTYIMLLFTYIAVASVVLNAMLMSVFERIHQFGIMKAVGVRPWQLIRMIYIETLIQTLLASVIGLIVGSSISYYFAKHGLDMSSMTEGFSFSGIALDPVWYSTLSVHSLVSPVLFLFVIASLAVIYPAAKAAFISPVDAIHHH